ncbi:MAG: VTT domain-containing protein [Patescibacteria group bacterium]|jgi:uncharacterized membrane protein YdjX (TVP38/TMEM64 family)
MEKQLKQIVKDSASRKAVLYILLYIAVVIIAGFFLKQYVDREQLRALTESTGIWGILVFGCIEYLYVIFVPINTTIHLISGYLFGGDLGWVLNFITTTAGLFTIIFLVKRYGRPLLEKIVSQKFLEQFDNISAKIGPFTLFVLYVLPMFPDDEITYLVAAANIKFKRFILPVIFGNITKAAISYVGDEGSSGLDLALGSRIVILIIGGIIIGIQEYIVQRKKLKNQMAPTH